MTIAFDVVQMLSKTYAHDPLNRRRNALRRLVVEHCDARINGHVDELEAVPGHARVFFFDANTIVDAALALSPDLAVFVPNLSHIM